MRILNQDDNKAIKNVLLMLTAEEAAELNHDLERLLTNKIPNDHIHVNDLEYEHELSISLYDENSIEEFNDRIKMLIIQGE